MLYILRRKNGTFIFFGLWIWIHMDFFAFSITNDFYKKNMLIQFYVSQLKRCILWKIQFHNIFIKMWHFVTLLPTKKCCVCTDIPCRTLVFSQENCTPWKWARGNLGCAHMPYIASTLWIGCMVTTVLPQAWFESIVLDLIILRFRSFFILYISSSYDSFAFTQPTVS